MQSDHPPAFPSERLTLGGEPVHPKPLAPNSASQWPQHRHRRHPSQQPEAAKSQQQLSPPYASRDDNPDQTPARSFLNWSPDSNLRIQDEMICRPFATVGGPSLATDAAHLADLGRHADVPSVPGSPPAWPTRLASRLSAEKEPAPAHSTPLDQNDNRRLQPSTPKAGSIGKMRTSCSSPADNDGGGLDKKRYAASWLLNSHQVSCGIVADGHAKY